MNRHDLDAYIFPAPPVCTARWTEADWLRFARRNGSRRRMGPAPSIVLGSFAHSYTDTVNGIHFYGAPLFRPIFGR